jgi:hypothetical protein
MTKRLRPREGSELNGNETKAMAVRRALQRLPVTSALAIEILFSRDPLQIGGNSERCFVQRELSRSFVCREMTERSAAPPAATESSPDH